MLKLVRMYSKPSVPFATPTRKSPLTSKVIIISLPFVLPVVAGRRCMVGVRCGDWCPVGTRILRDFW
ncbi:hypothetical protein Hdeb2414_s0088g00786311 [Helianthus debilis subsp. tardiflorus]